MTTPAKGIQQIPVAVRKAADIPDDLVLTVIRMIVGGTGSWAHLGTVTKLLTDCGLVAPDRPREQQDTPLPTKLVLAKLRNLERAGMITGCTCGCYGGFEVTLGAMEMLYPIQQLVRTRAKPAASLPEPKTPETAKIVTESVEAEMARQRAAGERFMTQVSFPVIDRRRAPIAQLFGYNSLPF